MSLEDLENQEEGPSIRKIAGFVVGIVAVLGLAGILVAYFLSGHHPAPKKPDEIVVHLEPPPPLPPPPPPPPPPPKPPEPKMVEQPPVKPQEAKPKPEAKIDKPPGPPGPKATGPASDLGLAGSGADGNGIGQGDGGGSKFGWYAAQVQSRIAEAFRQNSRTKDANIQLKVRIWVDKAGRITRADLAESTGDAAVDTAIRNEVLTGLVLQEPPPSDMPMPIVMRVTARRPA